MNSDFKCFEGNLWLKLVLSCCLEQKGKKNGGISGLNANVPTDSETIFLETSGNRPKHLLSIKMLKISILRLIFEIHVCELVGEDSKAIDSEVELKRHKHIKKDNDYKFSKKFPINVIMKIKISKHMRKSTL